MLRSQGDDHQLKLFFRETETTAVKGWFAANAGTDLVSSLLIRPEVHCAARRRDGVVSGSTVNAVLGLVELVDIVPIDLDAAADSTRRLRAADAIHLVTAEGIGAETMLVYDEELAAAAAVAGIQVLAPR